MSLFAFADKSQQSVKKNTYTVAMEEIPAFLQHNYQALRAGIHQVEPELLEWNIVTEPDSLELNEMTEDMDWCYIAGYYRIGNRKIDLCKLLTSTAEKKRYIPGRTWFDLNRSPLRWFHALGKERLDKKGRVRLTRDELLLLGCQLPKISGALIDKQRTGPLGVLLPQDHKPPPITDNGISRHLRSYQRQGVRWLANLRNHGLGGILADDMGLGKTHQALAFIGRATGPNDAVLVVCPAAVLYHWAEKQERFFPELTLTVYHGPDRDLATALKSHVIVTTYGVLRRDVARLAEQSFQLIVFDEMHYLKNRKTGVHGAARQLQAQTVFGLSGTPLENSIEEVATLLGLCVPGLFTAPPVRRLMKDNHTKAQRRQIRKIIHPFILRRTRNQVLPELPSLSEDIRLCELLPDQVAAYRQAVDMAGGVLDKLTTDAPIPDFTHILTTIIRLKQICNHLCLLKGCLEWDRYLSGKWTEFTRLINQSLEAGLKVVVFSQFTSMLDIMEGWLTSMEVDHVSLRGDIGIKERARNIKRFNTIGECRICCASLLAGGTGIDLTGAQVVIHYDRWWNSAKEEQATSRVHRMGQTRPVQVYKLVTRGTLEEKIHHLIEKKRTLAKELITEDEGSLLKQLDRHELAGLFRLTS
jgi:SNF2 family DNA or RNA helicase